MQRQWKGVPEMVVITAFEM